MEITIPQLTQRIKDTVKAARHIISLLFPVLVATCVWMTPAMAKTPAAPIGDAVPCPEIPPFDTSDWKKIAGAFRHATVWKFDQSWREKRERQFRGGKVRIGWRGDRLLYFADLSDRDVGTKAVKRNDRLWELGDVLEVFAGVRSRPAYIEYHTAPNGLVLQLFFPDARAPQKTGGPEGLGPFLKKDDSAVAAVRRTRTGWQVYGEIPAASVWGCKPSTATLEGQVWDLNFGRYDYPAGDGQPILSSTSPLTMAAYHRRHEWRQVRFVR